MLVYTVCARAAPVKIEWGARKYLSVLAQNNQLYYTGIYPITC